MNLCCKECIPTCDFCITYEFNGDEHGTYIDEGWYKKHKKRQDPGDYCQDFYCFDLNEEL